MRAARVHQGLGSSTLLLHGGTQGLSSARGVRRRRRRKGLPRGHLETTWEPCGTLGVAQAEGDIMELGVGRPHTQFFFLSQLAPSLCCSTGTSVSPLLVPWAAPWSSPSPPAWVHGRMQAPQGLLKRLTPEWQRARSSWISSRNPRRLGRRRWWSGACATGKKTELAGYLTGLAALSCSAVLPSWRFQAWQSFVPGCVLGQQNTRGCTSRQGSAGQGAAGREQAAFTGKRPVRGEIGLLLAPGH